MVTYDCKASGLDALLDSIHVILAIFTPLWWLMSWKGCKSMHNFWSAKGGSYIHFLYPYAPSIWAFNMWFYCWYKANDKLNPRKTYAQRKMKVIVILHISHPNKGISQSELVLFKLLVSSQNACSQYFIEYTW